MPAAEPRLKVNVLYVAGLTFQRALPEANQITHITRVTQSTLMLNGELDFFFPAETSQEPMFDLLGTAARPEEVADLPPRPHRAQAGADPGVGGVARPVARADGADRFSRNPAIRAVTSPISMVPGR